MSTQGTDVLIEQLVSTIEPKYQERFRATLCSIVLMAKAEGRMEAINTARQVMTAMPTRSLH